MSKNAIKTEIGGNPDFFLNFKTIYPLPIIRNGSVPLPKIQNQKAEKTKNIVTHARNWTNTLRPPRQQAGRYCQNPSASGRYLQNQVHGNALHTSQYSLRLGPIWTENVVGTGLGTIPRKWVE